MAKSMTQRLEDLIPGTGEFLGGIAVGALSTIVQPFYLPKLFGEMSKDSEGKTFYMAGYYTYAAGAGWLIGNILEHPEHVLNYAPVATNILSALIQHKNKVRKEEAERTASIDKFQVE